MDGDFQKLVAQAFDALARALRDISRGWFELVPSALATAETCSRLALQERGFYFVPEYRLETLDAKLVKLNRRAAKLGQPPVGYIGHGTELRTRTTESAHLYVLPYAMVSLTGSAPRVADATLLARVEHTEAGNIVSCAPGIETDPAWRMVDTRCEHCKASRKRVDTFAVRTADGVKMIGRNCLADFVRSADVAGALSMWSIVAEFAEAASEPSDSEWSSYGGGRFYYLTETFLACAARSIRSRGFHKSKDPEGSTADAAIFAAGRCPMAGTKGEAEWKNAQPETCDWETARGAVAWLKGELTEKETSSDFILNACVIAQLPALKDRHFGLAAAIAWSYLKKIESELAKRRERESRKPSTHFGEISKRYTFTHLTVTLVRSFDGYYGTTTLVKLVDDDGHAFSWFASGEHEFKAGEAYTGKMTVKKHETDRYTNEPITTVSRCALTKIEEQAA